MSHKKFSLYREEEPSQKVALRVMERVNKYERRRFKIRVMFHSVLLVGTSLSLVPTMNYLSQSVSQSGIMSYLSLIYSDSTYVLGHLNNLLLSIATSWPITASIIILTITLITINSIRRIMQYSNALSFNNNFQLL